jgi:hypothetical protein
MYPCTGGLYWVKTNNQNTVGKVLGRQKREEKGYITKNNFGDFFFALGNYSMYVCSYLVFVFFLVNDLLRVFILWTSRSLQTNIIGEVQTTVVGKSSKGHRVFIMCVLLFMEDARG